MGKHIIGTVTELPSGARKIVSLEGRSVGVFNVNGTYYALKNTCPHQGAPLCRGTVTGMTLPSAPGEYLYGREGEILRCPWHGWEFDITSGKSIYDPNKCLVKTYEVTVEEGTGKEMPNASETRGSADAADPHEMPETGEAENEPSVETYPVTVEAENIVVHL